MSSPAIGWRVAFAFAVAASFLVLYWPSAGGPGIPHADKVVHVVLFAAMAFAGFRGRIPALLLVAFLAVHAGSSEVIQDRLLPGRGGDVYDVVADLAGVLAGWVLHWASWRGERLSP